MSVFFCTLLIFFQLYAKAEKPICIMMGDPKYPLLSKEGDISIGAVFPVHSIETLPLFKFTQKPQLLSCSSVSIRDFRMAQIMAFAIEEINRNESLLPNVSLGYQIYDTCGSGLSLMGANMALMNVQEFASRGSCNGQSPVHAIIGETESSNTVILSRTTGPFKIPVISPSASCECLSNRKEYPYFFRTIASDYHQSRALAYIIKYFGWSWVGAVNSDNDYGNHGMAIFLSTAEKEGVCVEYSVKFQRTEPEKLKKVVDTIKKGTSKVIVAFLTEFEMKNLLEYLIIQNVTGLQVIGVEAWITANSMIKPNSFHVLGGSLGFAVKKLNIEGFEDYVTKAFWETAFPCSQTSQKENSQYKLICNIYRDLLVLKNDNKDVPEQRYASNVYKAVYAVAHSLHNILKCRENGACETDMKIQPQQVVEALRKVNFTIKMGDCVWFDSTGAVVAQYEVVNWQPDYNGSIQFKPVGYYDASLPPNQRFVINTENIIWAGGQLKPRSVCSENCPPGTRKAVQKGRPVCCYDCIPCAEGEISNETDSNNCKQCPGEYWSNAEKNKCVLKAVEFLSFKELMGIVLVFFSLLGAGLTTLVAILFYSKKDTPIVKANNSELSFLLLFSLMLCFLCSLTFIGRPTEWSCMLRHTAFGITFVLCISCVLGKTIVVLMAFKATLPGSDVMKWFGPIQQRLSVLVITIVQVLICVLWLAVSPPLPYKNTKYFKEKIILECSLGSTIGFSAALGYIGLLAILCFILAFLARTLPDKFNEAKFITFSMIIFCAVWITFIPSYLSSPGKLTVAVEIFAILASSFGLLFCIFLPKCYIIMCKPEQNTKLHIIGKLNK
ncbi:extracellular calcium-sensing receptor isoform X2 [Danio rerio]|uniref:Extracellular calcium-sensing receptor isoform X2 n=1 Tax=Danio rerio TaxID=7955 RepID=A0AC58HV97_DANRE|nr:extracellular calcium-sensing receptor-like isoform X2 [Danio rerio]XP_021328974.1 extracellular calcium-sensing receptor-like isoform X2 [Danio rerio]|eukprot:XP_017207578.1 extracellular calcium-sensing receptor-like isoform X2 [Danio rerio]